MALTNAPTKNQSVLDWIEDKINLVSPDKVVWIDGTKEQIEATLKPELYVGRSPYQVEIYLRDVVNPVLEANKEELGVTAEINV